MPGRPRHGPAGRETVLVANLDRTTHDEDLRFALRLHRVLRALRLHWLAGMRRYPVLFDTVATATYQPAAAGGATGAPGTT